MNDQKSERHHQGPLRQDRPGRSNVLLPLLRADDVPTSAWPWAIPPRICSWYLNWPFWEWAAATPPPWRTSRMAKPSWTWAPAPASTSSWRPKRSGQHGRVIGVDMTEDMVAKGPSAGGTARLCQRGISPGRYRASPGGFGHGGRRHQQLRHQPDPGQTGELQRGPSGLKAGRADPDRRSGDRRRPAAGRAGQRRGLGRLPGRGHGQRKPIWKPFTDAGFAEVSCGVRVSLRGPGDG